MGVPAHDGFPVQPWTRAVVRAARADAAMPASYPDACGVLELRAQIAGYLALARGIRCVPEQITITRGYRDGLNLAIRALDLQGRSAWMEDPGYFITRAGLALAGMKPIAIPVDGHGVHVQHGVAIAPDAAIAVVTAGQQAPLGVTLSSDRRQALVRWARRSGAWIIEDDYLSELQLQGRAAPALMAMEHASRVIYAGTFSKTIGPSLGVGFVVAPPALAARFVEVAECLAPAPGVVVQLALAEFLREGHYLRHLRRMKRLYAARRDALLGHLAGMSGVEAMAGLAVMLRLPPGSDDAAIARKAQAYGLAPGVLSTWYATHAGRAPGLLLGVTNLVEPEIQHACDRLKALVAPLHGRKRP
jgi:GntR family transcriptional regulator/MocR family aminotransferase